MSYNEDDIDGGFKLNGDEEEFFEDPFEKSSLNFEEEEKEDENYDKDH